MCNGRRPGGQRRGRSSLHAAARSFSAASLAAHEEADLARRFVLSGGAFTAGAREHTLLEKPFDLEAARSRATSVAHYSRIVTMPPRRLARARRRPRVAALQPAIRRPVDAHARARLHQR